MPRTTIDIDAQVLRDLKDRQAHEGKTLGQLISELLAASLKDGQRERTTRSFTWTSADMRPRVDITDKDAVYRVLDEP